MLSERYLNVVSISLIDISIHQNKHIRKWLAQCEVTNLCKLLLLKVSNKDVICNTHPNTHNQSQHIITNSRTERLQSVSSEGNNALHNTKLTLNLQLHETNKHKYVPVGTYWNTSYRR